MHANTSLQGTRQTTARFVLRTTSADGPPLYIGEHGPTITRADAITFDASEIEQRRNAAVEFCSMPFTADAVDEA